MILTNNFFSDFSKSSNGGGDFVAAVAPSIGGMRKQQQIQAKRVTSSAGGSRSSSKYSHQDKSLTAILNLKNAKSMADKYFAMSEVTRKKKHSMLDDYSELDNMINTYLSTNMGGALHTDKTSSPDTSPRIRKASSKQLILSSHQHSGRINGRQTSKVVAERKVVRNWPTHSLATDEDDEPTETRFALGSGVPPVIQEAVSDKEDLSESSEMSFTKKVQLQQQQRNREIYQSVLERRRGSATTTASSQQNLQRKITSSRSSKQFFDDEGQQQQFNAAMKQNSSSSSRNIGVIQPDSISSFTAISMLAATTSKGEQQEQATTTPSYAMGTFVSKSKQQQQQQQQQASSNPSRRFVSSRPITASKTSAATTILSSTWTSSLRPPLPYHRKGSEEATARDQSSDEDDDRNTRRSGNDILRGVPTSEEDCTPKERREKSNNHQAEVLAKDCEDIVSKISLRGRSTRTPSARPTSGMRSFIRGDEARATTPGLHHGELGGGGDGDDEENSGDHIFNDHRRNISTENDLQKLANTLLNQQIKTMHAAASAAITTRPTSQVERTSIHQAMIKGSLKDSSEENNIIRKVKSSSQSVRSSGLLKKATTHTILSPINSTSQVPQLPAEKINESSSTAAGSKVSSAQRFTGGGGGGSNSSNQLLLLARPESIRLSTISHDTLKQSSSSSKTTKDSDAEIKDKENANHQLITSSNGQLKHFGDTKRPLTSGGNFNRTFRPSTATAAGGGRKPGSKEEDGIAASKDIDSSTMKLMERYEMKCVIGKGSYAIVKLARDIQTDKNVAIKMYDKHKLMDPQKRNNVKREIAILNKLHHECIIKLYQTIDTRSSVNLVMEYISSTSLRQFMKDLDGRTLEERYVRQIFKQLVNAVAYCHDFDVIHRDIKLENIMLETGHSYQIKLIDFGFAIRVAADKKLNIFCGTPSYMAPEITKKKEYFGKPADVWSLGIVLYALVCSRFPFKGKDDQDLFKKIQSGDFKFPTSSSNSNAHRLITRILKQSPDDRPTAKEV